MVAGHRPGSGVKSHPVETTAGNTTVSGWVGPASPEKGNETGPSIVAQDSNALGGTPKEKPTTAGDAIPDVDKNSATKAVTEIQSQPDVAPAAPTVTRTPAAKEVPYLPGLVVLQAKHISTSKGLRT
ncbi:hypothetical protein MHU86_1714 [Fragilaria crotonensis]|nr:hypothetical protein MHU86_1714 [Fragilaria crotonensis]